MRRPTGHHRRLGDLTHELMTVMTLMYRSPPKIRSSGIAGNLHQTVGKGHHKAGGPPVRNAPDTGPVRAEATELQRQLCAGSGQKRSTHRAERHWERTVAMAAPRTPNPNT
jgi:hypothetical protein